MKRMQIKREIAWFWMDWAAVIALVTAVVVFTLLRGDSFFSSANAVNILRSMSITTIFAIGATITMAPDGFDMSACTLATVSSFLFASLFLWFGLPLWLSVLLTVVLTMVLYLVNMFLILVCRIPDMLATCALMFVYQGVGLWWTGGGAVRWYAHTVGDRARSFGLDRRSVGYRRVSLVHSYYAGLCNFCFCVSAIYPPWPLSVRHGQQPYRCGLLWHPSQAIPIFGRNAHCCYDRGRSHCGLFPQLSGADFWL